MVVAKKTKRKKTARKAVIDIIVDSLTDCIIHVPTSDKFATEIELISKSDHSKITKAKGWKFDWKKEAKIKDRFIYKLTIANAEKPRVIQGLLSVTIDKGYIEMHLIENAKFNLGANKIYEGVAGNLIAFACKLSFENGFDGFVGFTAKTNLIQHYSKTFGAKVLRGTRMYIEAPEAHKLVDKYFKDK